MQDQSSAGTRQWLNCPVCGTRFRQASYRSQFCSRDCRGADRRSKELVARIVPANELVKGTLGGVSELMVCVDLMKRGYHVFRATSSHGPCDIVAFRKGEACIKIEVKTGTVHKDTRYVYYPTPTASQEYDVLAVATVDGISYRPPLDG